MGFIHETCPGASAHELSLVFVLGKADRQIARVEATGVHLPALADVARWLGPEQRPLYFGRLDGAACWLIASDDERALPPGGWEWHECRALVGRMTPDQATAMASARQLDWWEKRHRFCGCCGTPTVAGERERARRCPACGASFFPSASPAVIVAITRGPELLLAHNKNFRPGMFSLLAGFLEPGETLEQAVVREVREEVGIEIADVRYVTSQPWPYPNSLMAGFRACHAGGEIRVDGVEIAEAGWFTRDRLPDIPRHGTVARALIERWLGETSA